MEKLFVKNHFEKLYPIPTRTGDPPRNSSPVKIITTYQNLYNICSKNYLYINTITHVEFNLLVFTGAVMLQSFNVLQAKLFKSDNVCIVVKRSQLERWKYLLTVFLWNIGILNEFQDSDSWGYECEISDDMIGYCSRAGIKPVELMEIYSLCRKFTDMVYIHPLRADVWPFPAVFAQGNPETYLIKGSTFSMLGVSRNRSIICSNLYSPDTIESWLEDINYKYHIIYVITTTRMNLVYIMVMLSGNRIVYMDDEKIVITQEEPIVPNVESQMLIWSHKIPSGHRKELYAFGKALASGLLTEPYQCYELIDSWIFEIPILCVETKQNIMDLTEDILGTLEFFVYEDVTNSTVEAVKYTSQQNCIAIPVTRFDNPYVPEDIDLYILLGSEDPSNTKLLSRDVLIPVGYTTDTYEVTLETLQDVSEDILASTVIIKGRPFTMMKYRIDPQTREPFTEEQILMLRLPVWYRLGIKLVPPNKILPKLVIFPSTEDYSFVTRSIDKSSLGAKFRERIHQTLVPYLFTSRKLFSDIVYLFWERCRGMRWDLPLGPIWYEALNGPEEYKTVEWLLKISEGDPCIPLGIEL